MLHHSYAPRTCHDAEGTDHGYAASGSDGCGLLQHPYAPRTRDEAEGTEHGYAAGGGDEPVTAFIDE